MRTYLEMAEHMGSMGREYRPVGGGGTASNESERSEVLRLQLVRFRLHFRVLAVYSCVLLWACTEGELNL